MKKVLSIILLIASLPACASRAVTPTASHATIAPSPFLPADTITATAPIAPPPVTIVAPTLAPDPTSIPDTRLPPERWREWPIVPVVTQRAIEIYRQGQSMGLDGRAFSKVGDCQSVKAAFMGYFDIPERYSLGSDYAYLQSTIDNFSGHFNTDGQAVRGGFNAAAVLSPLWADPKACLAGENPLDCELRINKPIIVFVSLEVWWNGRTPEQYAALMRRILDTIIAHGAVPILATKADNVEGDNSLNLTTAKLAAEYDLPLWNFWAAVQPLPDHGMDMIRNDGFHISTDAWSTRSFTALEALDSIWKGLLIAVPPASSRLSSGATATPGSLATLAPVTTPSSTLLADVTPLGVSGRIVFGVSSRQGESYLYPGVYLLDLAAQQTRQLFGPGVRFQSASPDGKYLLVSQGSTLYRINADGTSPLKLTGTLYSFGNRDAVWLSKDQIAVVESKAGSTSISLISANGDPIGELPSSSAAPIQIYPDSNPGSIYWEGGTCSAVEVCQRTGAWVTRPDGKLDRQLTGLNAPLLSPDGSLLAAGNPDASARNSVIFSAPDGTAQRSTPLLGNVLVDYAWSPAGDQLAATVAMVSAYSGKSSGNRNFLLDPQTFAVSEYPQSSLLTSRLLWSPDGRNLLWLGTLADANGFHIGGSLVDRLSKQVTDLRTAIDLSGVDYISVTNADWLPLP